MSMPGTAFVEKTKVEERRKMRLGFTDSGEGETQKTRELVYHNPKNG